MFALQRPDQQQIAAFVARQRGRPLNYAPVGSSADAQRPPGRWKVNHCRVRLGHGRTVFERALQAVDTWRMFPGGWIFTSAAGRQVQPGTVAAVVARFAGMWVINACRVVYVLDDEPGVRRGGFGYGTIKGHLMRGEERFCVEWHQDDDSVWYDVWSYSRPRTLLAWVGCPLIRALQRRFVRSSAEAMLAAVATPAAAAAAPGPEGTEAGVTGEAP